MKRRGLWLVCWVLLASFAGCAPSVVVTEGQSWAYDTVCTGKIYGAESYEETFESAVREGQNLLSADGQKQYTAPSDGASLPLSADLYRILLMADALYEKTEGVFDLTVAPLSALWDVNHADAPPSEEAIAEALSLVGWDKISLSEQALTFSKKGMGIDIGSVGKGYGADLTAATLREAGAAGGVLSFGGNVALFGSKEGGLFRVGIRDPQRADGGLLGTLSATDVSVVTTGAYERFFEYEGRQYHHLLDPLTGYPRESDLLSVTVVCADGAQADLMSTALWLSGSEKGLDLYRSLCETEGFSPCDIIFVLRDGTVWVSQGLRDAFTLSASEYRRVDL